MKNILKKAAKVIAIIAAYFISMVGAAIVGSAIAVAALEKKEKEENVKTEVKEVKEAKTERSNERVIIGFARTE